MSMDKKESEVSYSDLDRVNNRIRNIDKKVRLLVRILVDKKIIGTELAKSFEETSTKEILEWYENTLKEKKAKE